MDLEVSDRDLNVERSRYLQATAHNASQFAAQNDSQATHNIAPTSFTTRNVDQVPIETPAQRAARMAALIKNPQAQYNNNPEVRFMQHYQYNQYNQYSPYSSFTEKEDAITRGHEAEEEKSNTLYPYIPTQAKLEEDEKYRRIADDKIRIAGTLRGRPFDAKLADMRSAEEKAIAKHNIAVIKGQLPNEEFQGDNRAGSSTSLHHRRQSSMSNPSIKYINGKAIDLNPAVKAGGKPTLTLAQYNATRGEGATLNTYVANLPSYPRSAPNHGVIQIDNVSPAPSLPSFPTY